MKYNDTIEILKFFGKALLAPEVSAPPRFTSNNLKKSDISDYSNDIDLNNSTNNNIYAESEDSNIELNKNVPMTNNKSNEYSTSYNDYENNDYYKKQKDMSSNPQGVIDSITQEITPVRLQQAIILSEIVGKPRSKTRKKRKF